MSGARVLPRAFQGLICAAALQIAFVVGVQAQDMEWQFSEINDPANKGRMTASLLFGVPETDNIQVQGNCEARAGSGLDVSVLTMGVDIGELGDFTEVDLQFSGRNFTHKLRGSVYGAGAEDGITGVVVTPKHDDPLWAALIQKNELNYFVPGLEPTSLNLRDGTTKISNFLQACRGYEEALVVETERQENFAMPEMAEGLSEKEAFELAKDTGTYKAWSAFVFNFPKGLYANVARGYMATLKPPEKPAEVVSAAVVEADDTRPVPPMVSKTPIPEVKYPTEEKSFKDYQVSCHENGDCTAQASTKLQGGTAPTSQLSLLKTRKAEAPWVFSLSGFGDAPLAIKIGGNGWTLKPEDGIGVSASGVHFLPPQSDAILLAMRRGVTMTVAQTREDGAKVSARFSLRGLIAAMSFINKTQDHPNKSHVTAAPMVVAGAR